ncbi:MAG: hypothetical protein M1815_006191 [Lichina confinis]|nr:MAG: hypothetical protein M1815_006191 [Lichina confinis]
MDEPYTNERQIAELAVQRATILTKKIFNDSAKGTLSKADNSPVTIADFGAQALINHALQKNFPQDEIVAEEDTDTLREKAHLRNLVWDSVGDTRLEDQAAEELLGGPVGDQDQMLQAIAAGGSAGGPKGRLWVLDPVDGTKGFLRGGQYAVCLALIVDGEVQIGVLGCPNLPVDDTAPIPSTSASIVPEDDDVGVLFSATIGRGATSRALSRGSLTAPKGIQMKPVQDTAEATLCEGVEAGHSALDDHRAIAKRLGITKESVRIDSQAKYGSIARGAGDIYLRLPVKKGYQEKIWDHAAGDLIAREAGGSVTDAQGKRLDFSRGRTLADNSGVVASAREIHRHVLEAVSAVLDEKTKAG